MFIEDPPDAGLLSLGETEGLNSNFKHSFFGLGVLSRWLSKEDCLEILCSLGDSSLIAYSKMGFDSIFRLGARESTF
jgi:hypothetical protein